MQSYFITGTDTGVGNTHISQLLIRYWQQQGKRVAAFKPLASGADETAQGLQNQDALLIQAALAEPTPYSRINPFVFAPPLAPHIAAQQAGVQLLAQDIANACKPPSNVDITLIEGAGGWQVPINDNETMADVARACQAKVILVVAIRLGCLNHARLSVDNILQSGCELAGWVANHIHPAEPAAAEQIAYLSRQLPAAKLAECPYQPAARFSGAGTAQPLSFAL